MAPEQRQQQVLDSALRLVLREGYAGATMQSIAREAGVTRPVVYEFYSDRDDLLQDLLSREAAKALSVSTDLVPAVLSGENLESLVEKSLSDFLYLVMQAPDTWRLILMPPAGAPDSLRSMMDVGRAAILEQIRTNISMLPAPLGGPEFDAELLAAIALSASEAAARAVLADPEKFPATRFSEVLTWLMDRVVIAWSK